MPHSKIHLILPAVVLVGAGVLLYAWQHDRDARMIQRNLNRLRDNLEKEATETGAGAVRRSNRIPGFFAPDAGFRLAPHFPVPVDRRELAGHVFRARNALDTLEIDIPDRELTIADSRRAAAMRVFAQAKARFPDGQIERHELEFEVEWIEEDGTWLIREVILVQGVRNPR